MQKRPRYEVQTKYGWFSLDEGAYRDYLAGKLWITWPPEHSEAKPKAEYIPQNVSKEAVRLRELADAHSVGQTVASEFGTALPLLPYTPEMADCSIDELNLSVRALNGLMRASISTFGKLHTALTQEGGLFKIRNLGVKSEREIRSAFIEECYLRMRPYEKAQFWQRVLEQM